MCCVMCRGWCCVMITACLSGAAPLGRVCLHRFLHRAPSLCFGRVASVWLWRALGSVASACGASCCCATVQGNSACAPTCMVTYHTHVLRRTHACSHVDCMRWPVWQQLSAGVTAEHCCRSRRFVCFARSVRCLLATASVPYSVQRFVRGARMCVELLPNCCLQHAHTHTCLRCCCSYLLPARRLY